MAKYRMYIIAADGRFIRAVQLLCPDDESAKEQAKQLVDGHDIELWQGTAESRDFLAKQTKCRRGELMPPRAELNVAKRAAMYAQSTLASKYDLLPSVDEAQPFNQPLLRSAEAKEEVTGPRGHP